MKLEIYCTKCLKPFDTKEKARDRRELLENIGEYFTIQCTNCGNEREYHVNDVKARSELNVSILGNLIGISVFIVTTVFFWNKGFVTSVGLIIGAVIMFASNRSFGTSNDSAFNKYRIQVSPRNTEK